MAQISGKIARRLKWRTTVQDADALIREVRVAFEARDRDKVVSTLNRLLELSPRLATTWGPLSRLAGAIGEASISIDCARRHLREAPDDTERQLALASTLSSFSRMDEAIAIGREVVTRRPDHPGAHHNLGVALVQTGATEEAQRLFRRSIDLNRGGSPSWLPLASLLQFDRSSQDLERLKNAAEDSTDIEAPVRGSIYYALGKAHDDCGDYDDAFEAYSTGAGLIRAHLSYEENQGPQFVQELNERFNEQFVAGLAPSGITSDRPIFVFGLPRSGTTLVEQILVAHSEVKQGGELGVFRHAAMGISRFAPSDIENFLSTTPDPRTAWHRIGDTYLHLITERFGPDGRIVDKSLSTPPMLGVIAHVLPNARFVWMKRETAAVAWSCFKTRFAVGQNWSWSLGEIASHFQMIDGLHQHWTRLFGDRILTVQYEDLVSQPENWIPRILSHVGLVDEPGTRRFHEVSRPVQTASANQVRRPLYTNSGSAWKPYRKHLAAFFEGVSE